MDTRNIVLVGFMGTGKSATGRVIAERLQRTFVDMDTVIEERANCSIPDIFARHGEAHFRALERALVQELSERDSLVIAPGGGIVLNPDNLRDFERNGYVVCLQASPDVIIERVGRAKNRPLLEQPDKARAVRDLLAKRKHLYDAIPVQIDTDGKTPQTVADEVIQTFRAFA
jgi:shikimate kinase